MTGSLSVYIAGVRAGTLTEHANGSLAFSYDSGYAGVPLSLSMSVAETAYGDKALRPFLFGLLPDSYEVRKSLGKEYHVSADNPFGLLTHVGLDCPGAVQFCSLDMEDSLQERGSSLVPETDNEIAARLAKGRKARNARWETNHEHWSLGGQQAKFALRQKDGAWYSCEGAAATTHIFKPGIPDLRLEALNEYLCMKLSRACGIPTAEARYEVFEGEPAIIVTRYDRATDGSGGIIRLHQEDFCQTLNVMPDKKYTAEGGPGASDIIKVCRRTGPAAKSNIDGFISMLFFNYLIGAPDAHAKNYSLLLDVDAAYLAPLYDVASMIPYTDRPDDIKTAMGIAGENRVTRISEKRLQRFCDNNRLDEFDLSGRVLAERLTAMGKAIPRAAEEVFAENAHLPEAEKLEQRFLPQLSELCERALARLA